MRLVKSFLFAAIAAAVVSLPSDRSEALTVWPGGFVPIVESIGGYGVRVIDSRTGQPPEQTYTTKPGDKLRTKDGQGVLDRFGVSVTALREANPDALVPVCVGAREDGTLTTCREIHWYLRERVTLTIPPEPVRGRGRHTHVF